MVNDTNPEHYLAHPLWSHRGFSSNCNTQAYFNIMQENKWEYVVMYAWLLGGAILGGGVAIFAPPAHLMHHASLAVMATAMVFVTSHYQHDNTDLCGNIQHHTNFTNEGENGSGIKAVPHGVFNAIACSQLLIMALVQRLTVSSQFLSFSDFLKCYLPFQTLWLLWNMLYVHPHVHTSGTSAYPWPFSWVMQDYAGHVMCHHVNGLCMSSIPYTGTLHDMLLTLHGLAYKSGFVERLTVVETALNYVINITLAAIALGYLAVTVSVLEWLGPKKHLKCA